MVPNVATSKPKKGAKKGNSAAFRNWYSRHRDDFNAKRRAAYQADEERRRRILEGQQAKREEDRRLHPPHERTADDPVIKIVSGKQVEVFRIGQLSEQVGRSIEALRVWEREEKIPRPTIPGGHRYYTAGQVELVRQLADLMTELRHDRTRKAVEVPALIASIKTQWPKA